MDFYKTNFQPQPVRAKSLPELKGRSRLPHALRRAIQQSSELLEISEIAIEGEHSPVECVFRAVLYKTNPDGSRAILDIHEQVASLEKLESFFRAAA